MLPLKSETGSEIGHIKKILEACLLSASEVLSLQQLSKVFPQQLELNDLQQALEDLALDYAERGVELVTTAGGYRFRTRPEFQVYINQLYPPRSVRYTRALMETLAIIAYRQPVTRGEIEDLRGVGLNPSIIQTLLERAWIEVVGQKQVPGKPELFATTSKFLADLGLDELSQLPALPQLEYNFLDQDIIEKYDQQKENNER